jgi:MFS family permease
VLAFTIVNVALPSIQRELHVATTTLQWLVSAYAVAFGGFLLLGGRLADVYGRARMYRIGLVVFVVASISGGLAVEPGLLIASRVVQGIGAAMLAPAGLSLLVTSWPGEQERSRALGTYGAVVSAGFASGAVLGGLLVEATWRLVFFVNVPIGIALLAASMRLLPADPPGRGGQLDIPGAVTVTAGVALLVLAVVRAGDTLQATQPAVLGGLAALLLAAFVVRERRARAPLLDLALLKDRGIAGANLTFITVGAFSAAQVLLVTLYLQEGRGLSPVLTGLCFVPQAAGAFALSGPAGRLVPALGPRRAGHRLVYRAAGPGRGGRRGAGRFAARAASGPVRARRRVPDQPGRRHSGRHPRAGRRPVRGNGQRPADRQPAVRLGARRRHRVRDASRRVRQHRPADRRGHVRGRRLRPGRPAGHPGRAVRTAAPPDAAAAPSVPPPRRRDPLTAATPGSAGDRRRPGWGQVRACLPGHGWRASVRWPGGCDQGEVMTRYAVPGPPVQLAHGHVGAAGVPQHGGVAARALIDDAQSAAGTQDPCCLAHCLRASGCFPDVGDRQVADHHVERRGPKWEVTRVRVDKLHPAAHALGRRVALSGGAAVAALVAAAPYVRSHRPAGGQPPGRQHQHRAAAASHVQHVLIAPQAQLIQQLRPDRALARPGGVQVTRR